MMQSPFCNFWIFVLLLGTPYLLFGLVFCAPVKNSNRMHTPASGRPPTHLSFAPYRSAPWESQSKYRPGPPALLSSRVPNTLNHIPPSSNAIQLALPPTTSQLIGASAFGTAPTPPKPTILPPCDTSAENCPAAAPPFGRLPDVSPGSNIRFTNYAQGFSFSGRLPVFSLVMRRTSRNDETTTTAPIFVTVVVPVVVSPSMPLNSLRITNSPSRNSLDMLRRLFGW